MLPASQSGSRRERSLGQGLVELALVLPVLILLLLIAIDFGRVYLGYINLQQMARVAAGYAADNATAFETDEAGVLAEYRTRIENDARLINCSQDAEVPEPAFAAGYDIGDLVEVRLSCNFAVITPLISNIVGGHITVGARASYPVREGVVGSVPGGGGGVTVAPVADFLGSPRSGYTPLDVVFVDQSQNSPTSWLWSFGNGSSASTQGPHTRQFVCAGLPGQTCTYTVALQAGNAGGFATETKVGYVAAIVPTAQGPIAEFTASPVSGTKPLAVDFEFIDLRQGAITYTLFEWDFDGDGDFDATGPDTTASHVYANSGVYDVTLRVTDDQGSPPAALTKDALIVVNSAPCVVPDFQNRRVSTAQALWASNGFTSVVNALPPINAQQADYNIKYQSLTGGLVNPPGGCGASITVGPKKP